MPTIIRIRPIVWRLNPVVVTDTAKRRIAPIATTTMLVEKPIRPPCATWILREMWLSYPSMKSGRVPCATNASTPRLIPAWAEQTWKRAEALELFCATQHGLCARSLGSSPNVAANASPTACAESEAESELTWVRGIVDLRGVNKSSKVRSCCQTRCGPTSQGCPSLPRVLRGRAWRNSTPAHPIADSSARVRRQTSVPRGSRSRRRDRPERE